jgi:hypothetical protein
VASGEPIDLLRLVKADERDEGCEVRRDRPNALRKVDIGHVERHDRNGLMSARIQRNSFTAAVAAYDRETAEEFLLDPPTLDICSFVSRI